MSDNRERGRRVYTTELINQLIADKSQGYDIDYSPFFERDLTLRAPNVTFKMTEWEYNEYMKCYNDPVYFISNYCKFKVDGGYELVKLRDYQLDIINILCEEYFSEDLNTYLPKNKNSIICSSRQVGKTTTLCSIIAYKITFSVSYNVSILSNKEQTNVEIINKLTEVFKNLPYFLKPGCINVGKTGLRLENGSQVVSSATTNSASIGFTINFMLLDEFAHVPENIVNNFWRSVYPTLSSSAISQCAIISTPNGTTNKYYELWSGALHGENSFVPIRVDYWQVPGHDEKWAEQMKKDFGEEEFAQEFELQFNKNSKMIMTANDMKFIEKMCTHYVHKDIYVQNQYLQSEYLTWHPDFNPNSIDEDDYFVILVDIAEGNGDPSETFQSKKRTPDANTFNIFRLRINSPANVRRFSNVSCSIKDCVRFVQVGKYSCNSEDEIHMARVCSAVCYNLLGDHLKSNVKVMVEMNFNGKAFFEEFKRHSLYSGSTILKTYHKKPIPGEIQKKKYGFKTTSNKEYYCLRGNKLISRRRTIVTCIETFDQMKSFGYVRGSLKGIACHDDLSMPVFNHIPRMLDESTFVTWIEEYLTNHHDKARVYELNNLIQKWAMDNPDMSDDDFNAMYGLRPEPTYAPDSYEGGYSGYTPPAQISPYTSPYGGGNMTYPGSESSYPQYPGAIPSPYGENSYPSPYSQGGSSYSDILRMSQNM